MAEQSEAKNELEILKQVDIQAKKEEEIEEKKKKTFKEKLQTAFSFLRPLEDFAQETAKSTPVLETLDAKLSTTVKRIIGILVLIIGIIIIYIILSYAFRGKQKVEEIEQDFAGKTIYRDGREVEEEKISISDLPLLSERKTVIDNKNLKGLIEKADILYKSGEKKDALDIFEEIAGFSKSIANYNLGVIHLDSHEYETSISFFNESIKSGENVSLPAINAAVAAYKIGDKKRFQNYLNIAGAYINQLSATPPYAYVYGLKEYYSGRYFEALSPLNHINSNEFNAPAKRLLSKIYTLFNSNEDAYKSLASVAIDEDELALAQILAREGKLAPAYAHIVSYNNKFPNDIEGKMTRQILSLKMGNFKEAGSLIEEFRSVANKHKNPFPIKVKISPTIFDVNEAQKQFWERNFEHSTLMLDKILFYYAPYRVFDIQETLKIVSNGVLNSVIDENNLEENSSILIRSATTSDINIAIAQSLKMINNNNLREALKRIKKYADENPNYAVLHYNVGLMEAQMGNFNNAYKSFVKAFHLNEKDYLSGIFAIIAGKLTYKDVEHIDITLSQNLYNPGSDDEQNNFYTLLKRWVNNPQSTSYEVKEDKKIIKIDGSTNNSNNIKNNSLDYAFQAVNAIANKDVNKLKNAFANLKAINSNNIITNILSELGNSFNEPVKDISLKMQYLFRSDMNLDSVFYGPTFARELYVYLGFITGNLNNQEKRLNDKLISQNNNPTGIMQALALLHLYKGEFEISYTLYDQIINKLKEEDSNTRFLGAVAAIGANHNNLASILLQLSKMDSSSNYESRYALGLLYQEVENYAAASQLYGTIANKNFKSEFLDFDIDENKIEFPE